MFLSYKSFNKFVAVVPVDTTSLTTTGKKVPAGIPTNVTAVVCQIGITAISPAPPT